MKIAIIKYNAGNIMSVRYALKRLGYDSLVTDDPEYIINADKVIFPGVGEASSTMAYIRQKKIDKLLSGLKQPVLGICLGQQLMSNYSEEGDVNCIGIFDANVRRFEPVLKVPHMGWNALYDLKGHLFRGIEEGAYVYFVHSYYVELFDQTVAKCKYINPFSAAIEKDNYFATQFHPEKSGDTGQKILKNFIDL